MDSVLLRMVQDVAATDLVGDVDEALGFGHIRPDRRRSGHVPKPVRVNRWRAHLQPASGLSLKIRI